MGRMRILYTLRRVPALFALEITLVISRHIRDRSDSHPIIFMKGGKRKVWKSINKWGEWWGSNPRPSDSQSDVLTNWTTFAIQFLDNNLSESMKYSSFLNCSYLFLSRQYMKRGWKCKKFLIFSIFSLLFRPCSLKFEQIHYFSDPRERHKSSFF